MKLIREDGREEEKNFLPYECPHYSVFIDNIRRQENINKYSFTHRSVFDEDDPDYVDQVIRNAMAMVNDPSSRWHDLIERIWYSARKKVHIDFKLPVGMTIEEGHAALAHDLGNVPWDKQVCTPERYVLLTEDEIYRSESFGEELEYGERHERELAYQARGLDVDGRPMMYVGQTGNADAADQTTPNPIPEQSSPTRSLSYSGGECLRGLEDVDDTEAMRMMRSALRSAGLKDDFGPEGCRHEGLKNALAKSGICQVMPEEQVLACVEQIDPQWWASDEDDIRNLVRDFTHKYRDTPVRLATVSTELPEELPELQPQETAQEKTTKTVADQTAPNASDFVYVPTYDFSHLAEFAPTAEMLPDGVRQAVASVSSPELRIPALVSFLTCCGTYLFKYKFHDPMHWIKPLVSHVVVMAESGNGKSEVLRPVQIAQRLHEERTRAALAERKAYRDLKKSRKANQELPPPPTSPMTLLPLNSSNASRMERSALCEPEGRIMLTLSDEAGVIMSSFEKWSDIREYCNASWDSSVVDVGRVSDDSVEARVTASASMVLACQPVFKSVFVDSLLQGMTSRCLFCVINSKPGPMTPLRPISEADEAAMADLPKRLEALPGGVVELPKLRKALKNWEEETVKRAIDEGNVCLIDNGVRGRIMTSVGRLMAALTLCWMVDPKNPKKGGDSQLIIRQAQILCDYFSMQFTNLFHKEMAMMKRRADALVPVSRALTVSKSPNDLLLDELGDDVWTKDDVRQKRPDMKDSSLRSLISRWLSAEKIIKAGNGYRKCV